MKIWIVLIKSSGVAKIEWFWHSADARQYLADEMRKPGYSGQIKSVEFN